MAIQALPILLARAVSFICFPSVVPITARHSLVLRLGSLVLPLVPTPSSVDAPSALLPTRPSSLVRTKTVIANSEFDRIYDGYTLKQARLVP